MGIIAEIVPFLGYTGKRASSVGRKRVQHPDFGKALRALLGSTRDEERKMSGIICSALTQLDACRAEGKKHPDEKAMKGPLSEISSITLNNKGFSIRLYFTVLEDVIFMLHLDENKRRTYITDGLEKTLLRKLKETRAQLKAEKKT